MASVEHLRGSRPARQRRGGERRSGPAQERRSGGGDPRGRKPMTKLALANPIAILMACIGLIVFAGVTTPRLSVDTFPDLTPPVIVVGQVAPGLAAKDVEKAVTWRIERYVNGTPGVDHVESLSRSFRLPFRLAQMGYHLPPPRRWCSLRPVRYGGRAEIRSDSCRRSSCNMIRPIGGHVRSSSMASGLHRFAALRL